MPEPTKIYSLTVYLLILSSECVKVDPYETKQKCQDQTEDNFVVR